MIMKNFHFSQKNEALKNSDSKKNGFYDYGLKLRKSSIKNQQLFFLFIFFIFFLCGEFFITSQLGHFLFALGMFIFGVIASIEFSKCFTLPILKLSDWVSEFRSGNFDYPVPKNENDSLEIRILSKTLNDLAMGLRKDHKSLKESIQGKAIYETIFLWFPDPVFVLNRGGTILSANPAVENCFGFSAYELKGKNIGNLIQGEPCIPSMKMNSSTDQVVFYKKNKTTFIGECVVSEIIEKNESVLGQVLIIRDRTEKESTHKEKTELLKQLREALASRDDFISMCSHELKTPLTSLKLKTQLAKFLMKRDSQKFLTEENITEVLTLFDSQIDRVSRLVEDLSDVARIKSGKLGIYPKKASLDKIIRHVVDKVMPGIQLEKGRTQPIPFQLTFTTAGEGVWDPQKIEQVFVHLFSNAIKFGENKPVDVVLDAIENKDFGQGYQVSVIDRGMGIDPKNHKKIFHRYERAVSSQMVSGLGLGLYLSQQLIQAHGGSISVKSDSSQGAVFEVLLPLDSTPYIHPLVPELDPGLIRTDLKSGEVSSDPIQADHRT